MKRTTTESTYNNHTIMTNKERRLACEIALFHYTCEDVPLACRGVICKIAEAGLVTA